MSSPENASDVPARPQPDWSRLEALFHEALGLPENEREAFVERCCAGDPQLRQELLRLLSADAAAGGFDVPSIRLSEKLFADDPLSRPGTCVGAFKLDRVLGTGGMGTVWLAERADQQFEQRVALKVIKRGMDTDEILQRFRRERQVLARLEHPHIARLLDGGATADGRPYLVMEYIDGAPITEFCAQRKLPVADRLRLFLHICAAVQYAHQNLVVHRDLKPSNILVSGDGVPKLLDFGIAKILRSEDTQESLATAAYMQLLTPRYASPEQVRHEPITTATDVYSLGVILYELLTGQEPYQLTTRSRAAYEQAVCEQDPLSPSHALRRAAKTSGRPAQERAWRGGRLWRELDMIVLMAMRKEPTARYPTVQEFAEDIRRFLDGRPVTCRPQTARYRAAKFVARNRVAVLAGTVAALALVVGAAVSVNFAVREARQRTLAEERLVEARTQAQVAAAQTALAEQRTQETAQQRELAEERLVEAQTQASIAAAQRALAEERLQDAQTQAAIASAINKFLNEDLLSAVDPDLTPDPNVTMRSVLDTAAQKIGSRFQDQPMVEAAIRQTLGTTYETLGEYEAAEPHLVRGFELARASEGERSQAAILAMARLGNILRWRDKLAEAEPLIRRSVELSQEMLGPRHATTLYAMHGLGELYLDLGDADTAVEVLEETVKLRSEVLGPAAVDTFSSMSTLAVAYSRAGRDDDGERLNVEIVEQRTKAFGPDSFGTITALNNLAFVRMNLGKYEEAESLFQTAIERSKRVLGDEHPSTLISMDNLGLVYTQRGRYDEAAELHAAVYETRRRKFGPDHPDTLTSFSNLGFVYTNSGQFAKAEPVFAALLPRLQQSRGEDHPFTITVRNNLAYCWMELGRLEEAERGFADIVERRGRVLGAEHPETIAAMSNQGMARIKQRRAAEAVPLLADALGRASRALPEDHVIVGVLHYRMALCQIDLRQHDDAEKGLTRALGILSAALGPDHPRVRAVKQASDDLEAARRRPVEAAATPTSGASP